MGETHVFRTLMARVLTIAIALVAMIALVYFVSDGGVLELWRSGPVVVLGVTLVWLVFWQPRVVVSDGGVTVANILRTVHIPWPQFTSVDSKWSLTLTSGQEKVSAWAVPASSGMAARTRMPTRANPQKVTPGQYAPSPRKVNADSVALVIAERHEELRRGGHLRGDTLGTLEVTRTWNRTELIIASCAVVLAALSLLTG
ncbi:MAG TPA: PH domain-containing protein [Ruania sp.]|nr:PH domain-containing protein [Ruania sp.]